MLCSGLFGVEFDSGSAKWLAYMDLPEGQRRNIGLFETKEHVRNRALWFPHRREGASMLGARFSPIL